MKDYYKILGVPPEAETEEIRRAYRRRAKDVHPDVAPASHTPEADFILIREAYDVLISPEIRAEYDAVYSKLYAKKPAFSYRDFLLAHKDEVEYRVKLICYDLLHKFEDEALDLYEGLGRRPIHTFADQLDLEDFMDFGYIVADELFLRRRYGEAFDMFYEIALLEEDRPYFKHFYVELLARLKEITRRKLKGDDPDSRKLSMYEKLLELSFPPQEYAHIHKSIAELFLTRGEKALAAEHLREALTLDPGLSGLQKLKAKAGMY
ncbi:MAG: J domain-containing protein [Spirochaetales bacterium]|nr:J domain-containing protein [Spirochaetales bacterium]